jgi:hypothetical protein
MATPPPSPELSICSLPDIGQYVSSDDDTSFIPNLRPSNERHELVLFCVALELYKRFHHLKRCSGCKYNILSQSHHINCSTATSRSFLQKANFVVDVHVIWQHIWKLKSHLSNLSVPTEHDVNLIANKCKDQWRNLVITAILYELDNFPQQWQDCLIPQNE